MNTTNILLGTTTVLLIVALSVTFDGFNHQRESEEATLQRKALEAEIKRAEAEAEAWRLESARLSRATPPTEGAQPLPDLRNSSPTASTPASPEPPQPDLLEALEKERLKNAELEQRLETSKAETAAMLEEKNKVKAEQKRRADKIRQSLLMGTVTNADKSYGQVIFRPTASANFQTGAVLAIRRNQGIVGRVVVDRFDQGMYICTMKPNGYSPDGFPDITPGDEVIFDHGFE